MIAWRIFGWSFVGLIWAVTSFAADDLAPLRALSRGEPMAAGRLPNLSLLVPSTPSPALKARSAGDRIAAALADGSCPVGYTQCSDGCVDVSTSTSDCGLCGLRCPAGDTCDAGICHCGAGETLCPAGCVDVNTDPANCSACGLSCPSGFRRNEVRRHLCRHFDGSKPLRFVRYRVCDWRKLRERSLQYLPAG
jgi:hypothetical protein